MIKKFKDYIKEVLSENEYKEYFDKKYERRFIQLVHLKELEIRFDFRAAPNKLIYNRIIYDGSKYALEENISHYNKKTKTFYIDYKIWYDFKIKFDIIFTQTQKIMNKMVEKYFNLKNIKTDY